ncbi:MAG: hypothetical protein NW701_13400 [Nitrospira sp.]
MGSEPVPAPAERDWEAAGPAAVRPVWEPDPSVQVLVAEPAPGPSSPYREQKEAPQEG